MLSFVFVLMVPEASMVKRFCKFAGRMSVSSSSDLDHEEVESHSGTSGNRHWVYIIFYCVFCCFTLNIIYSSIQRPTLYYFSSSPFPQRRTHTCKVTCLSRVITLHTQIINPSQQELQLSICCSRSVLWDLMARKINSDKSQSSLRMPSSLIPCTSSIDNWWQPGDGIVGDTQDVPERLVVRYIKVAGGWGSCSESLCAVPGHVLNGD